MQMQAYHHSHLKSVMTQEGYELQYHIYTIALHRYLQTRLANYQYEKHFGGVYYLFLRGMNPHWGAQYGIFRAKPSVEFIESMSGSTPKI
jgi:exodeoxyribonuclease V beta subunit